MILREGGLVDAVRGRGRDKADTKDPDLSNGCVPAKIEVQPGLPLVASSGLGTAGKPSNDVKKLFFFQPPTSKLVEYRNSVVAVHGYRKLKTEKRNYFFLNSIGSENYSLTPLRIFRDNR